MSPHLCVLPAGDPTAIPMSGLSSDRMRQIIEEASARFEWVVIDSRLSACCRMRICSRKMVERRARHWGRRHTLRLVVTRDCRLDRKRIVGVVLNRAVTSPDWFGLLQLRLRVEVLTV